MCDFLVQSELMRLVASFKPLIASAKISERIFSIIKSLVVSPMPVQVGGKKFFLSDLFVGALGH